LLLQILDWENPLDRTLPGAAPPGWNRQWCCDKSATNVSSPARSGQYAARFQLDRNDPVVSSSKRAEISAPTPSVNIPERLERWYGFSIFLNADWKPDPSAESLTQWHQFSDVGGSPPLAILTRNGQWQLSRRWDNFESDLNLGAYVTDRWTDWVLHVKWAPDSTGLVEVWRDGNRVFSANGKNKYDDGHAVYIKFGIYKWDWQSNPSKSNTDRRIMYYDSLRIADEASTYADVDPAAANMQDVVLRPKRDVSPWTIRGSATAAEALDDPVTQPAPVNSTDYIWAGGAGNVTEISVGTSSIGQGGLAHARFYANTGVDTRLRVEVVWRGMILGSTTVDPGEPFQWRSVDFQLATAPAVDDLRLRFTSLDGGDSNVRAAYVAVQR
jgi:hypothetical protein